jgi:TorA maturation chaperone TorD
MTDHASWSQARGNMYKFLSAAYLEPPGEAFVAPLVTDGFVDGLEKFFGPAGVHDLRQFAGTFQGDYQGLDQEFQSLLMVPRGRYVTPYEAVYRDEREIDGARVGGLLMGPSTVAVQQLYREAGMAVAESFKDLPDHAGLELACMESLCRAEVGAGEEDGAEAVRRARALQRRLLKDHLLEWVPSLCARIREYAPGPFYRGIATLTEVFLRQEAEELAITTV